MIGQKALGDEVVVMVAIQKTIDLETSKDRPNTPPSLRFSEQRVHEVVGEIPPLDNVVGSKRLRSGRVNVIAHSHKNLGCLRSGVT